MRRQFPLVAMVAMIAACSSPASPSTLDVAPGGWRMIAAGDGESCGIATSQLVYCWSIDDTGAAPLPGGVHFQALVNSDNFFCGISTDSKVYCWTADAYGLPTAPELRTASPAALKIAVGNLGYDVPAGSHLCAIDNRDAAYCWGTNADGQLGLGDRNDRDAPTLVHGHLFDAISASGGRTCAVSVSGVAYCWGRDTDTDYPLAMLRGISAAGASVGPDHFCFLSTGGSGFCAGNNGAGQLGTGTSGEYNQPLRRVLDPQ